MSHAPGRRDKGRMEYPGDLAIAYRALTDAWLEGTALYWRRRAEQLEAARPRRGDGPRESGIKSTEPDVDWGHGWPTTCGIAECARTVKPVNCRHRRRPLALDEIPERPLKQTGPTPAALAARWNSLTEAASACRARAALADVARAELVDTITDVAGGAAA